MWNPKIISTQLSHGIYFLVDFPLILLEYDYLLSLHLFLFKLILNILIVEDWLSNFSTLLLILILLTNIIIPYLVEPLKLGSWSLSSTEPLQSFIFLHNFAVILWSHDAADVIIFKYLALQHINLMLIVLIIHLSWILIRGPLLSIK